VVNYKLGVGPMSRKIIGIINNYNKPLMVVASRNQVDYNSGYVCHTADLAHMITNKAMMLCRDHCGPYFSDLDCGLTLNDTIVRCKKTIQQDIISGFGLIHIAVATDLIEYALNLSPTIFLEFGSESNTGTNITKSLAHIDEQLAFISQYKDNIHFFVTQTGSLTMHTQVGSFNVDENKRVAEKIHNAGVKFKEHNADYLTYNDVLLRWQAGVDALNVAPQLGQVQTRLLYELAGTTPEWNEFANEALAFGSWRRWLPSNLQSDKLLAVFVSGHYIFSSDSYQRLMSVIDNVKFNESISATIISVFDEYLGRSNG
jgi:tagatose-1,6-bisphosphate aldolase non-catalytic subunit AgaZ/GatZ